MDLGFNSWIGPIKLGNTLIIPYYLENISDSKNIAVAKKSAQFLSARFCCIKKHANYQEERKKVF